MRGVEDESNLDREPDGADLAAEATARQAPGPSDAPADDYSQLARLADEFRGLQVAADYRRRVSLAERSDGEISYEAAHGDTRLYWRAAGNTITATIVPPRVVTVELQSPGVEPLSGETDGDEGTVLFVTGGLPSLYRLKIAENGSSWATPWRS